MSASGMVRILTFSTLPCFFLCAPPPPPPMPPTLRQRDCTRKDYVDRAPGELGDFGAFAKPVDEIEWEKVQVAELKHGRLAMVAVVGSLVQEVVTGEGPVEQLFSGKVSERAIV